MERKQIDWKHEYLLSPTEYPINDNNAHATYDQFISLRDTLVMTNKYYASSAWRSLIIWTKLDGNPTWTIEIREPNMSYQSFEPDVATPENTVLWKYVTIWDHTSINPLSCEIQKDGRYVIQHKEQFNKLGTSQITRILAYVLQHLPDGWIRERAVFDWEWNTVWEFKRMTSFGYVECNLSKWDWLELKLEDQNWNDIPLSQLQRFSNWWMVEYKDLSYN